MDQPQAADSTACGDTVHHFTPTVSGVHGQAVRPSVTRIETHAETFLAQPRRADAGAKLLEVRAEGTPGSRRVLQEEPCGAALTASQLECTDACLAHTKRGCIRIAIGIVTDVRDDAGRPQQRPTYEFVGQGSN